MKKAQLLFLSLLVASNLSGCQNTSSDNSSNNLTKVDDASKIQSVYNFQLEYELFVPGYDVSYNVLWTGYDLENKFGRNISKEDRYSTYLTKYKESLDDYYFVYVNSYNLDTYKDWMKSYALENSGDSKNYHFSDSADVIDGKYLLAARNNKDDDVMVYHGSTKYDIPFTVSNYQLAFCVQSKEIEIVDNISTGSAINKTIQAFRRAELAYDEDKKVISDYTFQNSEKNNVSLVNDIFSYEGLRIEAYPSTFETIDHCYCPAMGLYGTNLYQTIRADVTYNNVLLPRYIVEKNDVLVDLLDKESDFSSREDVFRDYKTDFLGAFDKCSEKPDDSYRWGLFSYEKVNKIIKTAGEK